MLTVLFYNEIRFDLFSSVTLCLMYIYIYGDSYEEDPTLREKVHHF